MRITREVKLGDRTVTVKELTVAEVRAWLKDAEAAPEQDPVAALLIEGMSFADIARMCDLGVEQMSEREPSAVQTLAQACREMNAVFFAMLARVKQAAAPARSTNG